MLFARGIALDQDGKRAIGILFHASLRGLEGAERDRVFEKLLGFTSLAPFTDRLAGRLSGGMPPVLQALTRLLPARYFNTCLRTIFLTGDVWAVFAPSLLFMGLLAGLLLGLVYRNLVKRLDT